MKKFRGCLLAAVAVACLAGCGGESGGGSSEPQGQVVAEVDGEEITLRELNMELRGVALPNPEAVDAAQRAALQAIVNRKILAKAAREQGLADSADFHLSRQRAEEALLAESLQRQMAGKVPRPTREEAEQYIAANPHAFGQRKFYIVEQIQFGPGANPEVLKSLAPLQTLDQVEAKLLEQGIEYRRVPSSIDARATPPAMVEQIANLPPGEVFIIPTGNAVLVNQITEERVIPFTGEPAVAHAQQLLFRERLASAVREQVESLQKQAGQVNYKQGYGPPSQPNATPQQSNPQETAPAENVTAS